MGRNAGFWAMCGLNMLFSDHLSLMDLIAKKNHQNMFYVLIVKTDEQLYRSGTHDLGLGFQTASYRDASNLSLFQ